MTSLIYVFIHSLERENHTNYLIIKSFHLMKRPPFYIIHSFIQSIMDIIMSIIHYLLKYLTLLEWLAKTREIHFIILHFIILHIVRNFFRFSFVLFVVLHFIATWLLH